MNREEELQQAIADVRSRTLTLLKTCEMLERSLPYTPDQMTGEKSWPAILGQIELIAKQLRDLHDEAPPLLHRWVPKPVDTFAEPNGMPSMFAPLLLQTKLIPELEKEVQELSDEVRKAHGEVSGKDLQRQFHLLQESVEGKNAVIEEADSTFEDDRRELLRLCQSTVERYSMKSKHTVPVQGIEMFRFLESGNKAAVQQMKPAEHATD